MKNMGSMLQASMRETALSNWRGPTSTSMRHTVIEMICRLQFENLLVQTCIDANFFLIHCLVIFSFLVTFLLLFLLLSHRVRTNLNSGCPFFICL